MNELEKKKKELEALIEELENRQGMEEIEKIFPGHPELSKFLYEETNFNDDFTWFDWEVNDTYYSLEKIEDKFLLTEAHHLAGGEFSVELELDYDLDELSAYILNADLLPEVEIKIIHKIRTGAKNIEKVKEVLRKEHFYEVE